MTSRRKMAIVVTLLALLAIPRPVPANVMPVCENLRRTESAHFIFIYPVSLAPQVSALIRLC